MDRLGAWRDGVEAVQRALKDRDTKSQRPEGIAPLHDWAWRGLDRLGYVTYDVRKPTHDADHPERTSGLVYFTVGGFRPDGARVERAAAARVEVNPPTVRVRLERVLLESFETSPRFRNATVEAGLGALRQDPRQLGTNRLIAGIWPGSGAAVLDYDRDGDEDLFVGDGVRAILYENDGTGCFTDVTERVGLARSPSEGIASTGVAAGDVNGDGFPDLLATDSFGPARLFVNRRGTGFEEISSGIQYPGTRGPRPSPTWTATATWTSSCASPATTTRRCRIPPTTRRTAGTTTSSSTTARAGSGTPPTSGASRARNDGRSRPSSRTTTVTDGPTSSSRTTSG